MSYVARCRYCGHHGPSMVRSPGSIVLEAALWLAPVILFVGAWLLDGPQAARVQAAAAGIGAPTDGALVIAASGGALARIVDLPQIPGWWLATLLAAWYSARRRLDRRPECEVCRVPYPEPEPRP